MIIVTIDDLREAKLRYGGYCTRGVDAWFTRHNLSLRQFLRHGYPIDVIEATNDDLGTRVAQIARERAAS